MNRIFFIPADFSSDSFLYDSWKAVFLESFNSNLRFLAEFESFVRVKKRRIAVSDDNISFTFSTKVCSLEVEVFNWKILSSFALKNDDSLLFKRKFWD